MPQLSEAQRIESLRRLKVLDTPSDSVFDGLVEVAAAVCGVPISLISLIDNDRQWFKANIGLPGVTETPREVAFCNHTIQSDNDILEICDASVDPRFSANPLVTGHPDIRFYAGHVLRLDDGAIAGTLCVIDRVPKHLNQQQRIILASLANAAAKILETRRIHDDLLSSEAHFRTLCETSPFGIFKADSDGSFTYTNQRMQEILDVPAEKALAQGWSESVHPEDKDALINGWRRAVGRHEEFTDEFRTLRSDDSIGYARVKARPVTTVDGALSGHVGAVADITEQIVEKKALQKERTRLESLIYGTGAGCWEWNILTGEVRINNYWSAIAGRNLSNFSPSVDTCRAIIHPHDLARVEPLLLAHFKSEVPQYEAELRIKHRDGRWVWVLDRGRVITRTADGKAEWMFGSRIDINQRKLQEQALHRSEQLLAQTGRVANVGGWQMDIASGEILWTDQTCVIHGLPPGYKPDLASAISYYAPEARPVIQNAVEKAINDGKGWDLELPFIQANGNRIWVRAQGAVEYDGDQPARLVGAFQDITERRLQLHEIANAHERVTLATRSGNIGVWDWNVTDDELTWSQEMFDLYDVDSAVERVSYDLWQSRVHPDDREKAVAELLYAIEHLDSVDSEFKVRWRDGSVHYLRSTGNVKRNGNGTVTRVLGVNWDVTPLRKMANEIAQQHELLRVTLQSIGDAVITTDASGHVSWMNPVAEEMTGWSMSLAMGNSLTSVFNIIDEKTRQVAINPVDACLRGETVSKHDMQTLLVSKDGTEHGIEESAAPIRNLDNEILGSVLVFHDVTEARRLSDEMSYRATHDSLTKLTNRSEFEARLQTTLDKSRTSPCQNALMYIDLDQFKLVNDTCGHTVGDQLLKQVSRLLGQCIGGADTLARLGGDEFGVILKDRSTASAKRIAQRMCESIDEFRFIHDRQRFRIGASIGLIPLDNRWDSTAAAMQAADISCYTAKEAGRNRVHEWYDTDEKMQARRDDMQWASRLEQAIEDNRFELYAQRIHAVSGSDDGIHAEVLIRLIGDDDSLVFPNVFLPAAERFHLASRIDRWVLQHSVDHLLSLTDISGISMLCVNLSGQSVSDSAFHRAAIALLTRAGAEVCSRLCLEITETVAVTNIADATSFVEQVRVLGIRVALDDFGAGASSFGYLKMLDVDILKIDGQFITGMIDDKLDAAAVRCFVDVAAVLDLKTVAEFVKSEEILQQVKSCGIDYAQGYLLHEPEPIESVLAPERLLKLG